MRSFFYRHCVRTLYLPLQKGSRVNSGIPFGIERRGISIIHVALWDANIRKEQLSD